MHVVAYQIAPYQNGMVTIMIPQIRFSDRPLRLVLEIAGGALDVEHGGVDEVVAHNLGKPVERGSSSHLIAEAMAQIVGGQVFHLCEGRIFRHQVAQATGSEGCSLFSRKGRGAPPHRQAGPEGARAQPVQSC